MTTKLFTYFFSFFWIIQKLTEAVSLMAELHTYLDRIPCFTDHHPGSDPLLCNHYNFFLPLLYESVPNHLSPMPDVWSLYTHPRSATVSVYNRSPNDGSSRALPRSSALSVHIRRSLYRIQGPDSHHIQRLDFRTPPFFPQSIFATV